MDINDLSLFIYLHMIFLFCFLSFLFSFQSVVSPISSVHLNIIAGAIVFHFSPNNNMHFPNYFASGRMRHMVSFFKRSKALISEFPFQG